MNISLPPGLEAFVREQVATGLYDSCSEVHREALRLLKLRTDEAMKLSDLRAAVEVGIEQANRGEARPCSVNDIVELARTRRAASTGR